MTLKAEPRRGATIDPPSGQGVLVDGLVGVTVEGFIVQGGSTGISFINAHDGKVRDNVVHSNSVNGINFRDSSNGVIENNIVHTNGGMGIKYEGGDNAKVRNNLVYNNGDRGISLEPNATSTDNHIKSNTVDRNVEGVHFRSGGGTIFDNIITNNGARGLHIVSLTGVQEDYNNISGHPEDFDFLPGPHTKSFKFPPLIPVILPFMWTRMGRTTCSAAQAGRTTAITCGKQGPDSRKTAPL